ncbi:hypothetical protein BD779DRAFT_1478329 [Infundibulicybe gibba]|nr:hypothetical protein BD779DRAFT_1478329 [Infundibulicybe gibba]
MFQRQFQEGALAVWETPSHQLYPTLPMSNRYLTPRRDAPHMEHIPFEAEVDPHGYLESMIKDGYIHGEENNVEYYIVHAKHERGKENRYKMMGVLHAIALLDTSFSQVQEATRKRSRTASAPRTAIVSLKRKVGLELEEGIRREGMRSVQAQERVVPHNTIGGYDTCSKMLMSMVNYTPKTICLCVYAKSTVSIPALLPIIPFWLHAVFRGFTHPPLQDLRGHRSGARSRDRSQVYKRLLVCFFDPQSHEERPRHPSSDLLCVKALQYDSASRGSTAGKGSVIGLVKIAIVQVYDIQNWATPQRVMLIVESSGRLHRVFVLVLISAPQEDFDRGIQHLPATQIPIPLGLW